MADTRRIFIDLELNSNRAVTASDAETILSEINGGLSQDRLILLDFCGIVSLTNGFLNKLLLGIANKNVTIDETSMTNYQRKILHYRQEALDNPPDAETLERIENIILYG